MLSHITGHDALVRGVAWATAVCLVAELALIDLQVLRGTTSHFNLATPFDATVTAVMGGAVVVVFTSALVAAGLLLSQRGLPVWISYGIGGGLVVVILGMAEAVLMIANTNGPSAGGHTVGAPDGGPGLPFLGWSTQHGDLRVAHFIGLHGLQVIPLVAWGAAHPPAARQRQHAEAAHRPRHHRQRRPGRPARLAGRTRPTADPGELTQSVNTLARTPMPARVAPPLQAQPARPAAAPTSAEATTDWLDRWLPRDGRCPPVPRPMTSSG